MCFSPPSSQLRQCFMISAPAETVATTAVEAAKPVETPASELALTAVEEPKVEEAAPAPIEAPK